MNNQLLSFKDLLELINIPFEIRNDLMEYSLIYQNNYQYYFDKLKNEDANYEEIKKELVDENGLKILTIYLLSSLDAYKEYLKLNIDINIFIDSFKSYSRFLNESMKIYNKYVYDRYFWSYRYNNLKLFRIGNLEFELTNDEEISIHIPSDASLALNDVIESIKSAKEFFLKYFLIDKKTRYFISSWILSPSLKLILNKDSNIIKFQELFQITSINEDDYSYLLFVFKTASNDVSSLKEETSLQRGIKKLLKENIKIGSAKGYLK